MREAFAKARPHPLRALAPRRLRAVLIDALWDVRALWDLTGPVEAFPIDALRWHYEYPWWTDNDGRFFSLTPAQVLAAPGTYPHHERRIRDAELTFPVHVVCIEERWQILDGMHRLVKADQLGHTTIDAVVLTPADVAKIIVTD